MKAYQNEKTGYREYFNKDILSLKFIGKARKFIFSIPECKELLFLYENKMRPSKEVKKITLEKISEIDIKLQELQELQDLRNDLNFLANSCQGDDRSNCPILDELSKK